MMPRVIQKMISGRKKRLALRPGIYCGQTTPTVRMSVIVRRRTRVNHSSHSLVAKLLSIARPRLYPGIPESWQEMRRAERVSSVLRNRITRPGENRLVISQLADE